MHVLVIPSWYPDTPDDVKGVFFRDQAMALSGLGHKVGVVALSLMSVRTLFRSRKARNRASVSYEADNGVATYRKSIFATLPRIPYGNFWLYRHQLSRLLEQYVKEHGRPDVIHAHSALYAGAASVSLGAELDIPVVVTEHSSVYARGYYAGWQLRLAETAFSHASGCICVSPALGALLENLIPVTSGRWRWIPNVVAERFCNMESQAGAASSRITFLNLAMMTENKGQSDLIAAFHDFQALVPESELLLGGDGPARSVLEGQVHDMGLSGKVRFLGVVPPDEVPGLLARVDVMVIASHYETFGVVAAESLMAGVPVIATRCGGPESIVLEGDGELVSAGAPDELMSAMHKVTRELGHYDRHGIASRAHSRFSGVSVANRLIQEYERVLTDYAAGKGAS
ncbi:glycosyltransferase [Marinobacter sp. M1N3S26]|uniref:glycosyltransferase n=1 Tax=Marinobacter sp. M1N3S26 TaxID=3382299 RepID=UPI00387B2315